MFSLLLKLKRRIKRLLKVQSVERQEVTASEHSKLFKFLMLILFSVLIGIFYPGEALYDPLDMQRKGEIAREDLLAPFKIVVKKTDRELREEQEDTKLAIPFIIDYDSTVVTSVFKRLDNFIRLVDSLQSGQKNDSTITDSVLQKIVTTRYPLFSVTAIQKVLSDTNLTLLSNRVKKILEENIYSLGVLPDHYSLPESRNKSILVRYNNSQKVINRSKLKSAAEANVEMVLALNKINDTDSIDVEYYHRIGRNFIQPNMHINMADYNLQVETEIKAISPINETVEKNDIILTAGKEVTERQERILREMLKIERAQAVKEGWYISFVPLLSRILLIFASFLTLYLFMFYFRRQIFASNPKLIAMFLVFAIQLFLIYLAELANAQFELSQYIYPVALLPIMITILFDVEVGILSTVVLAFLLGILHRFDFGIAFMTMTVGTVGAFTSRRVRKRSEFFRIMYSLVITFVVYTLLMENIKITPNEEYLLDVTYGIVNGIVVSILVIAILPVIESLFGFTTDITLLELSDLNHPLLKRLSLEAPGTYHHSILVGTLSEAAAKAIGGNSLLARVGAYFHDIGKIEIPEYFVENQLGLKSKHEELTPSMSSIILSSHVKKGRLLGEEADIPDDVLNFIEEHHGTMIQSYFYNKAIEQGMDKKSASKFRYPGPKPQKRETGIAMLADAVEAASRTLDDPKPARIDNLIQRIINDRFESGELDECPLTLKDLAKIKEAFSQILIGTFHQRISYPKMEDKSR
ncbi:MAG: HDIG domain-containing protein [Calditrichaeota bacterium]|nr:MAG: HDIG domain-containing protein [Calditrichota bacterium]